MRATDLSLLQPSLDRKTLRNSKRASLETTITPELADSLGKSYILGRFTSPEIAASAAVAGISNLEDLHMNVATQLLKQGIVPQKEIAKTNPNSLGDQLLNGKPGDVVTYTDPRTGKPVTFTIGNPRTNVAPTAAFTQGGEFDEVTKTYGPGVGPTGLRKRTEQEILASEKRQRELAKRVPVFDADANILAQTKLPANMQRATSAGEALALPFQIAGAYFGVTGSTLSMIAPDQFEILAKGLRATSKTVTAIAQTPADIAFTTARLALRDAYVIGQTDASPWERFTTAISKMPNNFGAAIASSTGVMALTDILAGQLDTGKGYLYAGESGQRARELRDDMVGTRAEALGIDLRTSYIPEEEKPFYDKPADPGFFLGEALVDAKLTTRDSEVYQVVEDATNTFLQVMLDPGLTAKYDIVSRLATGLVTSLGVTQQVAKSYVTARQAGKYEEALRIAVENGMDVRKAEYLTESERLTNLAGDIVNPPENIVYSGDRSFTATDQPTKFKDVDAEDFEPNASNLYGEGLYVTDSIYTASSTGYNVEGVQPLTRVSEPIPGMSPNTEFYTPSLLNDAGLVPEGVNLEQVGYNQQGVEAGVWKFDKTELNILDTDKLAIEVPEAVQVLADAGKKIVDNLSVNTDNFIPEAVDEFALIDTSIMFPLERANDSRVFETIRRFVQDEIDSKGVYSIGSTAQPYFLEFRTVEEYITYLKNTPQYLRHLERTEPLRNLLQTKFGFDEEVASVFAHNIQKIIFESIQKSSNPIAALRFELDSAAVGKEGLTIGDHFQSLYKIIENLRRRDYTPAFSDFKQKMSQALYEIGWRYTEDGSQIVNINDAFKNFFNVVNSSDELIREILDGALKHFYDEPTRLAILNDVANPTQVLPYAIGKTNPMTQAMVNLGYDGMRYNGGGLVGGTGDHNAYVVWKPSKLSHVDTMTGEKFPTNQLLENLREANRYGYEAQAIDAMKELEGGWKQGMGVIGMDPKMIDANLLNNMKVTPFGQSILQAIADESNPVVIWRKFLKEKSPGAAILLSKASTIDEVFEVLKQVVDGTVDINVRNLPNGWKDWVSDTGFKVKQKVDYWIKQTAMMPQSTYISFDDPVSAVQNTDRLLQIVGVRGPERDAVLEVLFKAIDEQTSTAWDDFFAAANEKTLTKKMAEAGWTPELIKEFTSYRRKGDDVTRWTLEDLADDIPIEWFDEGDGPLRLTQLLSGGGWLLEPEVIDLLIRDLNPVIKGLRKISKDNPAVAKAINVERTLTMALETMSAAWVKPAALGAPLPFRYILRVVPELMARVAFSGMFENLGQYMAAIFTGHLNYDTFGRTIRSSQQVAEEMAVLNHLKDEYKILTDPTNPVSVTSKAQRRIKTIEKKYGTEAEIQARIDELTLQIDDNIVGDQRALVNNVRGHLEGTNDPQVLESQLRRSENQSVVTNKVIDPLNITKKEKRMRANWVKAQAQDIAQMAADADYRAVASALRAGDPALLEQVAQDLLSGDLRKSYETYKKKTRDVKPDWDWETIEAARSRVNEIVRDIKQRTALQPDILDALMSNSYKGESLSNAVIDNVYQASVSFRQLVREVLLDNPGAPTLVPYYPLVKTVPKAERNANFMYRSFGLYTKAAAGMARNPVWAQAYWKRIIEMMEAMDPTEAAAMVAANVDKLPDYTLEKLQDALPSAKGELNRDEVSRIAEVHAREVTDKLLYNANEKSYFQYRHPLFFMFFDAYREQWMTWLKLMKNPANIHKVDVINRSLKNFREPFSEEDNTILHNDPTSGKQVVSVPFSRWMLGLTGGEADFAIPTRNLSFVGTAAPTVGVVPGIFASSWNPSSQTWADLKQTFAPFSGGNTDLDWRDYFIPKFAQLAASGIAGVGKEKLPSADILWGTLEKFAGPTVEKTKKNSVFPIMRQLATQMDKYPLTVEGRKQLVEDANALSDNYAIASSLARQFLPAAPITKWYIDTKQGNVLQGLLLDEIRNTENEIFAKGGTMSQAVTALFEKYGPGIWAMFGTASETSVPGLQPTKEYQSWIFKNKGLLDEYPNAGGYLGPQQGEYNPRIYTQQALLGQRGKKDPGISLEDAASVLAETYFDYRISSITPGYEDTQQAKDFIDKVKTETEERFPSWSPLLSVGEYQVRGRLQMLEIRKMIEDYKVLNTAAGFTLKQYMNTRDTAVQQMIDYDSSVTQRNWKSVEASYSLRQYLFYEGNRMAMETPEFAPMWQNILKKEFETKDIVSTVEASK